MRGFACDIAAINVDLPEQPDIGQQLELELQMTRLARRAIGGLARCSIDAALEARVAQAATATVSNLLALSVGRQVRKELPGIDVVNHRPCRNPYLQIVTRTAGFISPGPALPAFRTEFPRDAKVGERIDRGVGDQVNAAAMAAVAAVGTAAFDVLLTPKAQRTMPSVAGNNADCCFVDEFHTVVPSDPDTQNPACAGFWRKEFRPVGRPGRNPGSRSLNHADVLTAFRTFLFETDLAILLSKQRMVAPETDIHASVKSRAALTNDDIAGNDFLAAKDLHAKALAL